LETLHIYPRLGSTTRVTTSDLI